jgi:predicted  nucleic acid-binding Zn-ribbon protein
MNASALPLFHTWITVILMPASPDYHRQVNEIERALKETREEQAQLLARLDTATRASDRDALLTEITRGRQQLQSLQKDLAALELSHRERN